MKTLNCSHCGKYLGEIEKGRIIKNAIILCANCNYQTEKIINDLNKLRQDSSFDFLKNTFGI